MGSDVKSKIYLTFRIFPDADLHVGERGESYLIPMIHMSFKIDFLIEILGFFFQQHVAILDRANGLQMLGFYS